MGVALVSAIAAALGPGCGRAGLRDLDDQGAADGSSMSPTSGGSGGDGRCTSSACKKHIVQVVAGNAHTCALFEDGHILCWGVGGGVLGLGDEESRGDGPNEVGDHLPAIDLGAGNTAKMIAARGPHTCALLHDGRVKCWGVNDRGQLGLGDTKTRGDKPNQMGNNLPAVDLGTGSKAVMIAVGDSHTCALLNDGRVKCWGFGERGQLGLGDTDDRGDGPNEMGDNLPVVNLGAGAIAVAISAGWYHTCALLNDGRVKCWGHNIAGELGLGDTKIRGDEPGEMGDNLPAVNLGAGTTVVAIAAGGIHTCALLSDGRVKCWGLNSDGVLGLGDMDDRGDQPNEMGDDLRAVDLGTGTTVVAIAAGVGHNCVILSDSRVKCWGFDDLYGTLGLGTTKTSLGDQSNDMGDNLPVVDLGTGLSAAAITAGDLHSCVVLSDGHLKCWGGNSVGQLGLGDVDNRGDEPNEMGDNLPAVDLGPRG